LARLAGYKLQLPPLSLLGQFTTPGQPEPLSEWFLAQGAEAKVVLVSADMLAYGGLIASRTPDVSLSHAQQRLSVLSRFRQQFPSVTVYASNVLMRTSLTASSPENLRYWRQLHRYSELLGRRERTAQQEREQLERDLPPALLQAYHTARARNHAVNRQMVEYVAAGVVDYLILTQEDAAEFGPHREEQMALRALAADLGVSERVSLHPGASEAALTLLARWVNTARQRAPRVAVYYASAGGAERISPFEDRPLRETVEAHVGAIGAEIVPAEGQADFLLLVNTPRGPGRREVEQDPQSPGAVQVQRFVDTLARALEQGWTVALADVAFPNGADTLLMELLTQRIELPRLTAYAGWDTAGNTLGTVLAQACLHDGRQPAAQVEFLFSRFVDDYLYQSLLRPQINAELERQGLSPLNLGEAYELVKREVAQRLEIQAREFFDRHFRGCRVTTASGQWQIGKLVRCDLTLPWPRTFEVEVAVEITGEG